MATKTEDKPQTLPVAPATGNALAVSPEMAALLGQSDGKALEQEAADRVIPMAYVLQGLSPQVQKRNPDYVEGAEPGMIWLRNSGHPVISGDEGLLVQACYMSYGWVEWIPRDAGGGYIATHADRPADAIETPDPKDPRRITVTRPNGNELVETRQRVCNVFLPDGAIMPYVFSFKSSGHTVSKTWSTMMTNQRIGGNVPDPWTFLYRLKTKMRSNAKGDWFVLDVSGPERIVTPEEFKMGRALYEAFVTGEKVVEAPLSDQEHETTGDDAAM